MHDHFILAFAAVLGLVALSIGYLLWEVRRAEPEASRYDFPEFDDEPTPIYEALCFEQWEAER